jgi:hypothetical protein
MNLLRLIAFFLSFPLLAQAQFDQIAQVSIPVFMDENDPSSQSSVMRPTGELSGIALMLFEEQGEEDYIQMIRQGDPILWIDRVGISSKATFVIPDEEGLAKMEMLLSNGRLSVKFRLEETELAWGVVAEEKNKFVMRLVGDPINEGSIVKILGKVNNYLMRLHLRKQKKIIIRPGFNQDTLNVICGYDTQFDTNYDVIWLDEDLYKRLENEAQIVHRYLSLTDSLNGNYKESVQNSARVEHTAKISATDPNFMYGTIVILFEVLGGKDYYFLQGEERYQIAIDYLFNNKSYGKPNLTIEKLMLRNVQSGDFLEMSMMDLTSSKIPIIYIDLINSVIMDDYGTWNIVQVFTVLEDIFGMIDLPNERGQ